MHADSHAIQNSKWVWSGNTTITNCRQTHGIVRKIHTKIRRHKTNKAKQPSLSLFPIKMVAKLEWTQSNAQQNIKQLQNPTIGLTINNKSTTTEPPPKNGQHIKPLGGSNAFYLYQIFALDSAVVEAQTMLSSHGGFLAIAMYHHRETI